MSPRQFPAEVTPKAFFGVVVDDADCLHPGIHDNRTDEFEALSLQLFRQG